MSKEQAEKWAEDFLNSEQGLEAQKQFEKDFLDYVVYGKSTKEAKDGGKKSVFILDEIAHWDFDNTHRLSIDEVIEKYSDYLSEEQINELKRLRDEYK